MKLLGLSLVLCASFSVWAEDELIDASDREPAAVSVPSVNKRLYPGGADEDDLLVQARLPEAGLKTDQRSLQRGVFKNLYNQEMKEDRQDTLEE